VFFDRFWPEVAAAVTGHHAGADADIWPLLRRLQVKKGARVLDVPCGYGRHSLALAARGYRVSGVDINAKLLGQARAAAESRGLEAEFRRWDMRRLPFRGSFDLVLNLFTSFGYFGDAGDAEALRSFCRALRPGGWLALQMVNRDWVMRHFRSPRRSRLPGGAILEESTDFDFTTSIAHSTWVVRRRGRALRGRSVLRFYSAHELRRMFAAAGFRRIQSFGSFTGAPLSLDSRWQLHLGQKP
jgi:SAM-dependent methyltransferase